MSAEAAARRSTSPARGARMTAAAAAVAAASAPKSSHFEAKLLCLPLPPAMCPLRDPCADQLLAGCQGYARQRSDAGHQGQAMCSTAKARAGTSVATLAQHARVELVESVEQQATRVRGRQNVLEMLEERRAALDDAVRQMPRPLSPAAAPSPKHSPRDSFTTRHRHVHAARAEDKNKDQTWQTR